MNRRIEGIGMTSRRTRERMVARLREQGIRNSDVLQVMLETPRHLFVEEAFASRAYEDTALPIGFNQTISQPYIVARMTELLLAAGPLDKVLEVGTGSGYQTDLNIRNVRLKRSDGGWGWDEYGPYDGILAAAAPSEIPETLLTQMGRRSVMIIPVGQGRTQTLKRITRSESGFAAEEIEPVTFVPFLTGVV